MQVIDTRKLKENILNKVKTEVAALEFQPVFCDVLVGDDPSSAQYVRMKARAAESAGIKFHSASFPETITTEELIEEIKKINKMENMCGIIVQLPLSEHINKRAVLDSINPTLDVDCLGSVSSEKFYKGENKNGLPTALACMAILESLNLPLENQKIVVLGQGILVGKPVTALLELRGLKPIPINTKILNKEVIIKEADIIISGMGQGKYLTGDMVKEGVIVIDAGTSEENGSIVGDVDFDSVKEVASYISSVPGGVGPVTVAMLLNNVLNVAKKIK